MSDTTTPHSLLHQIATDGLIDQHCRHVELWHALGLGPGVAPTITLGAPTNTTIPDPTAWATNQATNPAATPGGAGAPTQASAPAAAQEAAPGTAPTTQGTPPQQAQRLAVRLTSPTTSLDFDALYLGDVIDNTLIWATELPIPEGMDHPAFHEHTTITDDLIGATRTLLGNGLVTFVRYSQHKQPADTPARATAIYIPLPAPQGTVEQLYHTAQPALHRRDHVRALTGLAATRALGMRRVGDQIEFTDGSSVTPTTEPTPAVSWNQPAPAPHQAQGDPLGGAQAQDQGKAPAHQAPTPAYAPSNSQADMPAPAPAPAPMHTPGHVPTAEPAPVQAQPQTQPQPQPTDPAVGTTGENTLDAYYNPIALLSAEHQVTLTQRIPHATTTINLHTNTVTLTTPAGTTTLGGIVLATIGPNGWQWAPQDPALPQPARDAAHPITAFAREHNLTALVTPPADEATATKAIAVAKAALGHHTSIRIPLAPGVDGIVALIATPTTPLLAPAPPTPALLWDIAHTAGALPDALGAARSWLSTHNIPFSDHGDRLTFPLQGLTMVLSSSDTHHLEVSNQ